MHVTTLAGLAPYSAPGHFGMTAFRLQGQDASPNASFWCGLSRFEPGGGAERATSPLERVYVVIDGCMTVITDDGERELMPLDSCRIAPGEPRALINRGATAATMLVIGESARAAS